MTKIDESRDLKRFLFNCRVKAASGFQTFRVDAESLEQAEEDFRAGGGEIHYHDVEVTDLDEGEFDSETTLDDYGDFQPIGSARDSHSRSQPPMTTHTDFSRWVDSLPPKDLALLAGLVGDDYMMAVVRIAQRSAARDGHGGAVEYDCKYPDCDCGRGDAPPCRAELANEASDDPRRGDVLAKAWYHYQPADEDGPEDYEIYSTEKPPCPDCVPVLIVRADSATSTSAAEKSEPLGDARDGIEMAALLIDGKLEAYIAEHGSYDHTTGQTEFKDAALEYITTLEELAEEIRDIKPHAGEKHAAPRGADASPKITADELAAFNRFCDTCEDSDAGGYDVPKSKMQRLARIGLVRWCGGSRYETTEFGDSIRDAAISGQGG